MKILLFVLLAVVLSFGFVQCSKPDSVMTKDEEHSLRYPRKFIPPEAARAMANMGDLMRQQQKRNQAAGVDERGVPIIRRADQDAGMQSSFGPSNRKSMNQESTNTQKP